MEKQLDVHEIAHNSAEYDATIQLRDDILRKPLGLVYSKNDLDTENDSFHLAIYREKELAGCLVLKPLPNKEIKMRQVAVKETMQGMGVGRKLVEFAEQFAREKGYYKMVLHARLVAMKFYQKLDYDVIGEEFEEVGIPHFKMEKALQ